MLKNKFINELFVELYVENVLIINKKKFDIKFLYLIYSICIFL